MKEVIKCVVALAVIGGIGLAATGAAQASAGPPHASAIPPHRAADVFTHSGNTFEYAVRPGQITFSTGYSLTGMHWTQWAGGGSSKDAYGTGTWRYDGSSRHSGVHVTLYALRSGGVNNFRYYDRVVIHGGSPSRWHMGVIGRAIWSS